MMRPAFPCTSPTSRSICASAIRSTSFMAREGGTASAAVYCFTTQRRLLLRAVRRAGRLAGALLAASLLRLFRLTTAARLGGFLDVAASWEPSAALVPGAPVVCVFGLFAALPF